MLQNEHVRKQQVTISVTRDGVLRQTLVVDTNLIASAPEINQLADEIVAYLNAHSEIDNALINCIATMS